MANLKMLIWVSARFLFLDLMDAASRSLDVEKYSKAQMLNEYRKDFAEDVNHKNKIKESEMIKAQRDKESYVQMCNGRCSKGYYNLANSAKEEKNEEDFKQKFRDIDARQSQYNKKFSDTVLTDYSRRKRHNDAITQNKPAYYDIIENEQTHYLDDKANRQRSAWQFQKNSIDQKYRQMLEDTSNKTKNGEQSYQEYLKYQSELQKQKEENRARQGEYANVLKTQVKFNNIIKQDPNKEIQGQVFLGKYKVKNNSSMPMIPGISSVSALNGLSPTKNFSLKFKGLGPKKSIMNSSMDAINTKTLLDYYNGKLPNNKLGLSSTKFSSKFWMVIAIGNTLRKVDYSIDHYRFLN
jgi:hypothetical protein